MWQTVGTRTFKGAAFVSRPEVIEFKDFAIDKPHRKRILLTNVSLTFNRFKVSRQSTKKLTRWTPQADMSLTHRARLSVPLSCHVMSSCVTCRTRSATSSRSRMSGRAACAPA